MTRTRKKTTVAVLRFIIGVKAKDMADVLGCSEPTINSLETTGRLKLSEAMAQRMFHETGISPAWLLCGDAKASPIAANGEPYTRKHYERAQAGKKYHDRVPAPFVSWDVLLLAAKVRAILTAANRARSYSVPVWRLHKALDALAVEVGVVPSGELRDTDIAAIEADLGMYQWGFVEGNLGTPRVEHGPAPKPASPRSSRKRVRKV